MKKIVSLFIVAIFVLSLTTLVAAKKDKCTTIQDQVLETTEGDLIPMGYITEGPRTGYNYQAKMYNGDYYGDGSRLMMKWNDAWLSNKDCDDDDLLDRHLGFDTYIGSGAWLTNHWFNTYELTHWDVTGTWLLDFAGGEDNREFVNLVQDVDGNVVGEFWYLSGGDWLYGGTLEGTVTGDELYLHYERPLPLTYTGDFYGVIGENIITDGTFTDSHGNDLTWTATGTSVETIEVCEQEEFIKIVAVPEDAYLEDGFWFDEDGVQIGESIWGQFAIIQYNWYDSCDLEGSYTMHELHPGLGNW